MQNTAFKAVAINILTVKKVAQSEEPTEIYHASRASFSLVLVKGNNKNNCHRHRSHRQTHSLTHTLPI